MTELDDLRATYQAHGLSSGDLAPDPMAQFARWFDDACRSGIHEPEAMVVSTATPAGVPSSWYVLMRDWADDSVAFFTNYDSQKGHEITGNPAVSVLFPWHMLSRQVRMVGRASRLSSEASDAYFLSRARDSQIGAWASAQSSPLADRAQLVDRVAEVEARFEGVEVPRPAHWGGYRVVPDEVEFWQGRPSRLHDRFRYRRDPMAPGTWTITRLSP